MMMPEHRSPEAINADVTALLLTPEHVVLAPGVLARAPECALLGCAAHARSAVLIQVGWSWFCEAHMEDIAEQSALWPYAPV
jgi:hypothetical protein